MYIESLKIENFRTFETAEIRFNLPGPKPPSDSSLPNVTLLLGDNGAGKTSVLRAAALAALGPILTSGSAGYVPYSLVRRAGRNLPGPARARVSAELLLHKQDGRRGVVLIDEVDLHLHPEWQQQVIPTLARALPNLQFVLTSHSPLVVGTLRGANVFVLETEVSDGIRRTLPRPSVEEVYGLSSDQILTSGHFGLKSARDPEFTLHLQTQAQAGSRARSRS